MALRNLKLLNFLRKSKIVYSKTNPFPAVVTNRFVHNKVKEYRTENNFVYLEDPDKFGTLGNAPIIDNEELEDEDDKKELKLIENNPLPSQKLTTKQYSDLIKQYLKHKRLKEAIDILEVRMLNVDRVKPSNYIYNILIGACAEVGYTKKSFKLYNDMKRRALKATGDTYTCLFEACANSPWPEYGLKNARNLRTLMQEKGIEPNVTNYNVMLKAFGRCGDLSAAFQIVDEMISKKIKIRVHTLNNLLHACISDKASGLRHALLVWRKMLRLKEKPNIYSFNLMLKCVKECNLGTKEDMEELLRIISEETPLALDYDRQPDQILQLESNKNPTETKDECVKSTKGQIERSSNESPKSCKESIQDLKDITISTVNLPANQEMALQFVEKVPAKHKYERTVPNLLSKKIKLNQVQSLQEVKTLQDKFAIIGGQEDFLREMEVYSVKPDIKTFTQMISLADDNTEAEIKLMDTMKAQGVRADIDFYNMLIKKRCLRLDYASAQEVKDMIEAEDKRRRRKHPMKKNLRLKCNVMTYGILAMACETKETAEKLLTDMKENQLKVNMATLGTLLRQGTAHNRFDYVTFIMEKAKEENVPVNKIFLKHLESFISKCNHYAQDVDENGISKASEGYMIAYNRFLNYYKRWLKDINAEEALEPEHPWQQFRDEYPETVQRTNVKIEEPKRFFKRNRKYVKYVARL